MKINNFVVCVSSSVCFFSTFDTQSVAMILMLPRKEGKCSKKMPSLSKLRPNVWQEEDSHDLVFRGSKWDSAPRKGANLQLSQVNLAAIKMKHPKTLEDAPQTSTFF